MYLRNAGVRQPDTEGIQGIDYRAEDRNHDNHILDPGWHWNQRYQYPGDESYNSEYEK